MKNKIYIVVAYRWGERSNHSYTVGAFETKEEAIVCADGHRDYRGGKYSCEVEEIIIGGYDEDMDNYAESVYHANGMCEI